MNEIKNKVYESVWDPIRFSVSKSYEYLNTYPFWDLVSNSVKNYINQQLEEDLEELKDEKQNK